MASLLARVKALRVGDPFDERTEMGPLATERQRTGIETALNKAVDEGAVVLRGGNRPQLEGWYFEPTVLACPDHKLSIVDTELFGPVLSVLRFRDEAEVVAKANDTKYGLAAGLFTRDLGRALRMTKAVRAGIQYVNCYRVAAPIAEIGGFKSSGSSREGGLQALADYTRTKTIWIDTRVRH